MAERLLMDAGPLVALFRKTDRHHQVCVDLFEKLSRPPLTCWPVVTETAWLLRHRPDAIQTLLAYFDQGALEFAELGRDAPAWIARFLDRYRDQAPDLADAALMYLVERDGINTVFTLDRKDFTVYRKRDKQPVRLIPEP